MYGTKKPLRRKCKYGCGLVPIIQYEDHIFCHEAQTELVPLKDFETKQSVDRVRRQRKQEGGH